MATQPLTRTEATTAMVTMSTAEKNNKHQLALSMRLNKKGELVSSKRTELIGQNETQWSGTAAADMDEKVVPFGKVLQRECNFGENLFIDGNVFSADRLEYFRRGPRPPHRPSSGCWGFMRTCRHPDTWKAMALPDLSLGTFLHVVVAEPERGHFAVVKHAGVGDVSGWRGRRSAVCRIFQSRLSWADPWAGCRSGRAPARWRRSSHWGSGFPRRADRCPA